MAKITTSGNSRAVIIPSEIADRLGFEKGTPIKIEVINEHIIVAKLLHESKEDS